MRCFFNSRRANFTNKTYSCHSRSSSREHSGITAEKKLADCWPHGFCRRSIACNDCTQRALGAQKTSLLRQNDVATSFWRNNDVLILRRVLDGYCSTNCDYSYGNTVTAWSQCRGCRWSDCLFYTRPLSIIMTVHWRSQRLPTPLRKDLSGSLPWRRTSLAHLSPMSLPMGRKLVNFSTFRVQTLRNAYLCNHWTDLLHSKFYGTVQTCSCTAMVTCLLDPKRSMLAHGPEHVSLIPLNGLSSFEVLWNCIVQHHHSHLIGMGLPVVAHWNHMDLSIDWNAHLWNCCPLAPYQLAHGPNNGPMLTF